MRSRPSGRFLSAASSDFAETSQLRTFASNDVLNAEKPSSNDSKLASADADFCETELASSSICCELSRILFISEKYDDAEFTASLNETYALQFRARTSSTSETKAAKTNGHDAKNAAATNMALSFISILSLKSRFIIRHQNK